MTLKTRSKLALRGPVKGIPTSRLGLFAAFAAALYAAGCAGERDPVDRTQANIVSKSFLLGEDLENFSDDPEFRMKAFSIDVAANTVYTGGIGTADAVDRLRWEVTENFLFARRSYQETPGADIKGLPRKLVNGKLVFPTKANGTIIAAYKIISHFDIRREFNASTGEENNVIVEDEKSRPWNQRTSMRVDWSKNVANSNNGDTSYLFGGATANALEYSPTEKNSEDKPNFSEAATGYFDITNKYVTTPESVPSPFGTYPECVILGFLSGTSSYDCTPPEATVRTSFQRLDAEEDFESFEENIAGRDIIGNWNNIGNNFQRGYGAAPITTWDPQYGFNDAKTKTLFAMHEIWEKSHWDKACTSNEQDDAGTAVECGGYTGPSKGSQCDTHLNKCTIPVRDRSVKTVGWWLNADAPVEFTDSVKADGSFAKGGPLEEMTVTWNQLFRNAVAYRREVECRRTDAGKTRVECHAEFFEMDGDVKKTQMVAFGGWGTDVPKTLAVDKGRPLVATCHNPVRKYDPEVCGKEGAVARLGDVRKNHIIYWPYASRAPYGGIASIASDPLSGQMIGATATIMGRSVTAAAAQVRDIIQLNSGEIKVEDIIAGNPAVTFADRVKNGKVQGPGSMSVAKTPAEIKAATASVDQKSIQRAMNIDADSGNAVVTKNPLAALKNSLKLSQTGPGVAAGNARVSALIAKLSTSPEFQAYNAGKSSGQILSKMEQANATGVNAMKQLASLDQSEIGELYDAYMNRLGQRGICFHDSQMAAGSGSIYIGSLAKYFQDLYADAADPKERGVLIYKDLVNEIIKGIGFHEVGHAIGMRHNFASSWDSVNYQPQYWQLRTKEGTETAKCVNPGDKCMGPRYLDPVDADEDGQADESRPGLEYFAGTSTMEYQVERFGETAGAGTYDQHFVKTLYGRVLETFDQTIVPTATQKLFQGKLVSQGIPNDLVSDPESRKIRAHYTQTARLAKNFDSARDCRDATDEEKAAGRWRIVHGKLCAPPPKNHIAYGDMKSGGLTVLFDGRPVPFGDGQHWRGSDYGAASGDELIRWNYRYGEGYSQGGYLHDKIGDSGGDVYEVTQNLIRRFDRTYPWTYFGRGNREYAWWSVASSVGNNAFKRLRGYHWNTVTDLGRSDLEDDDLGRPSVMANAEMFNFLQRVVLTPEPGDYWPQYEREVRARTPRRAGALLIVDAPAACSDFNPPFDVQCKEESFSLPLMDGRYIQTDFDSNRGGSWDYQNFVNHVGFDDEKVLALRELVDARPSLSTLSRDNALDNRDVYVSFRTDAPHAVDRLVGSILAEDWEMVSPMALADKKTLQNFPIYEKDPTKLVRPAGSTVLFPNLGYAQESGVAIYALLFSRSSTDLTLANKLRVRLEGDSGTQPQGAQRAAFVDPLSGARYLATRFGTETIRGRQIETGIASRMLERANELAAEVYISSGKDPVTGEVNYTRSTTGAAQLRLNRNEKQLRRYIGMLDAVRQVGNILGGGPLGGGGGGGGDD